jgi:hypothetical protein
MGLRSARLLTPPAPGSPAGAGGRRPSFYAAFRLRSVASSRTAARITSCLVALASSHHPSTSRGHARPPVRCHDIANTQPPRASHRAKSSGSISSAVSSSGINPSRVCGSLSVS